MEAHEGETPSAASEIPAALEADRDEIQLRIERRHVVSATEAPPRDVTIEYFNEIVLAQLSRSQIEN